MKSIYIFLFAFITISCGKSQDTPSLIEDSSLDSSKNIISSILKEPQPYAVYLPPSYHKNTLKQYPVLYLLHGLHQDHNSWIEDGNLKQIADEMFAKDIPEMIIVCPKGYNSFYVNTSQMRYEDFFITEFIPTIEKRYRILANSENRHIAGLSMGGFGATYLAFKYSNLFASAYAMSGGFLLNASDVIKQVIDTKEPSELAKLPRYSMECGTEDILVLASNDEFSAYLQQKAVEHTYVRRSGSHNWRFWKECLPKVLLFTKK